MILLVLIVGLLVAWNCLLHWRLNSLVNEIAQNERLLSDWMRWIERDLNSVQARIEAVQP